MQGVTADLSIDDLDDLRRVLQPGGGRVSEHGRLFSITLLLRAEDQGAAIQAALAFWQEQLPCARLRALSAVPLDEHAGSALA
jgi:hypothetical protein